MDFVQGTDNEVIHPRKPEEFVTYHNHSEDKTLGYKNNVLADLIAGELRLFQNCC